MKANKLLDGIRYAAAGAALASALVNIAFQPSTLWNWVAAIAGSAIMLALVKSRQML